MINSKLRYIYLFLALILLFSPFVFADSHQSPDRVVGDTVSGGQGIQGKTVFQMIGEALNGTISEEWFINLAVIVLIVFILFAIMDEIKFFQKQWIHWTFAVLFALIATSVNSVMTGVVGLITFYGTAVAIGVFFAVFFLMGLSHFYRKKIKQFDFVMGSEFLTIFIIHLPMILMLAFVGAIIGGIGEAGTLSSLTQNGIALTNSILIPTILIVAGVAAIVILLIIGRGRFLKSWWFWMLLVVLLVAVPFGIGGFTVPGGDAGALKFSSQVWGAILGTLVGLGFALLEKGRAYAKTQAILSAYKGIESDFARGANAFENDKRELIAFLKAAGNWSRTGSGITKSNKWFHGKTVEIPRDSTRENFEKAISKIDADLRSIYERMDAEKKTVQSKFRDTIWDEK